MTKPAKTILVVDDEPMVEEVIEAFAQSQGCLHVSYNDPREASTYFEQHYATIDLAIIDLIMPGMTGLELADRMCSLSPGLPIILLTGQASIAEDEARKHGVIQVLSKPVTKSEFLEALNGAIGACTIPGE